MSAEPTTTPSATPSATDTASVSATGTTTVSATVAANVSANVSAHDGATDSAIRTFLFTDIEGSTRLWEQEPERMRAAVARHDAVSREAVLGAGGQVVKTTGDGVHAAFADELPALLAALRLQQALAAPAAEGGLALKVRCGLHCGESEARDGDFFGPALNRAARVMGAAHGGQTLLTQAVAERLRGRLPSEVTLLDLGAVRLRDLASREQVYQLKHPSLRAQFPPLRSLEATPNNLAQQLNSFVGRERELAEVRTLLAKTRLLTLLGMGGIGKSRLSVQLGAELLDEYPDGVWLVELAPLADARGVPQALATVLGVREEAGLGVVDALLAHVRDKRLLVILDNCEHVLHACADLAKRVLQAGAQVKVLTTSRDVLQVAGETVYAVPTLAVPEAGGDAAPAALARHAAVRLFVDRAAAVQPGFRLDAGNASAVAEVCRQLDGIALALELAAARTRALSVQAIAARLSDRFRLLVSGDRTVLPRQRTLRALIDWSFDLLDEAERSLFRRLAVFAGGWTLESAEVVCEGGGIESPDVLDLLAHLVEKSLVVMDAGGMRYRMLETVRAYALEKLGDAGDEDATRARHLEHFLGLAETARPHLAGPVQGLWLKRLDPERENFLAAFGLSARANDGDLVALRLMHALRPYWVNRGELSQGLEMARDVLARPALQRRDASRCMALFSVGQLCFLMGRSEDATDRLEECLAIAREIDEPAIAARTLQPLGMTCLTLRNFAAADAYLQEAVELAHGMGDERETACALNALAMLHRVQGTYDQAWPLCERELQLFRNIGDQELIAVGLLSLAMLAVQMSRLGAAQEMLRQVTAIAVETGSLPALVGAAEVCCGLCAARQTWAEAATLYGAVQALREKAGLRRDAADEAFISEAVARTAAALGADDAKRLHGTGSLLGRDELLSRVSRFSPPGAT